MTGDSLRIEITLSKPGEWRVVERSHSAAESVARVPFTESEFSDLLSEIQLCLCDANASQEAQRSRLCRLGGRLAEISLPVTLRGKVAATREPVEFFLDDTAVLLPVELFPCGDTVLAEAVPVSRHWFCENALSPIKIPPSKARQILIVADPAENLPGAQREGEELLRKLRSLGKGWNCRFLGRAVTGAELARELPDTDVLHLAAHYAIEESESTSGVALVDGLWMPSSSSHTPNVVFANCCRAGLPSGNNGELSLVGRFLRQGTGHVIAPFLPASDSVGKSFASAFYQSFFSGKEVALAVWEARKAVGSASWIYWHFGVISSTKSIPGERRLALPVMVAILLLIGVFGGLWHYRNMPANETQMDPRNAFSPVPAPAIESSGKESLEPVIVPQSFSSVEPIPAQSRERVFDSPNEDQATPSEMVVAIPAAGSQDEEVASKPHSGAPLSELRQSAIFHNPNTQAWNQPNFDHDGIFGKNNKFSLRYPGETTNRMHKAAQLGNIDELNAFRSLGWPNDMFDKFGMTTMMKAAAGGQIESLQWLKDNGDDVNKRDKYGATAFHIAAAVGDIPVMQWLLDNGADINTADDEGWTPMHYALFYERSGAVAWLREHGGSPIDLSEMKSSSGNAFIRVAPDIEREF